MKQSRVLNRPMFNRHNSAYGRGIASNLVTDEQRIRYNAGGRVGLKYGSEWLMKLPIAKKAMKWGASKIPKKLQPGAINPAAWKPGLTQPGFSLPKWGKFGAKDIATGKSIAGKGAGWAKALGKKMFDRPGSIGLPVVGGASWGISKFFGGDEEEIAEVKGDGDWAKKLKGKPVEVEKKVEEVIDWTPKEKEEKKRDIALAMAERLIGGSRDKWGSTAQAKNLAGALGDIRKITDKEDIRKDQRKYRAATKMYKDIADAAAKREGSYAAMLNKGADHPQALRATTGISGALTLSADPKQRKDQKKQIEARGPGTVFFDETSNSWHILTPDGSIKVTINEIEEAYKTGKIDEMRKPPEEKEVVETETIDTEGPVTQAGSTEPGIIKFDPNNVQLLRN